jgi:hypothetical protein
MCWSYALTAVQDDNRHVHLVVVVRLATFTQLEAYETGVAAEIENVAMYDRLISATDQADVIEVFKRLQAASRDHHLPAFQRCVERGGTPGGGPGFGRGRVGRQ